MERFTYILRVPYRSKNKRRVESTRAESLRSQRDEALGALRERFGSDAVERTAFAFFAKKSSVPNQKRIIAEGGGGGGRGGRGARWGSRRRTARGGSGESDTDEGEEGGDSEGNGDNGGRDDEGYHSDGYYGGQSNINDDNNRSSSGGCGDVERRSRETILMSMVPEALRPAYGPDCCCGDYKHEDDDDGAHARAGGAGAGAGRSRRGNEVLVSSLSAEAVEEAVTTACGIDCSTLSDEKKRGLGLRFEDFLAVANRLTSAR